MEEADGFLGIGTPKQVKNSENSLQNVYNYALPTAYNLRSEGGNRTGTGFETLADTLKGSNTGFDKASDTLASTLPYWKSIMSGNRSAVEGAVAPETNSALAESDATRRQQATMGTARGGGVAGANRTAHDDVLSRIDNLIFGARPAAAQQVAQNAGEQAGITGAKASVGTQTGGAESQIGLNEIQQALAALGIGANATSNAGSIALKQEELGQNGFFQKLLGDIASAGTDKLGQYLFGGKKQ